MKLVASEQPMQQLVVKVLASSKSVYSLPLQPSSSSAEHVNATVRDQAVKQLRELTKKLKCYPETFARAVSILDAFLLMMKVKP